ncbi:MAG: type II toxin-antitoxin system Phd/YefM family antitoxin [Candidatus Daviesbacteria bacterium]|nr:type II toxin-antitoxin system Phd/YefM family antitoxin [Candidatus Daviesbacteria bacterium]
MTTVSATTARANFYDLIDKVFKTSKPVGITKFGVLKVVLVSAKEYDNMMEKIYGSKKHIVKI